MGRFDALTQIEESKNPPTPSSVATPPATTQQPEEIKKQLNEPKKSTKPQTSLPTNQSPTLIDPLEKPEKYTTHLEPSLVKKLKLHATERDMKDYQVMKKALLLYFDKVGNTK